MVETLLLAVLAGAVAAFVGALVFVVLYTRHQRRSATGILGLANSEAERIRLEAQREAEATRSELLLSAKMETLKLREDLDREIQRRREEWDRLERRAEERARAQERKLEEIDLRERGAAHREEALTQRELSLRGREGEADRLAQEQRVKLERIAGLTAEDARREILQRIEDEARGQAAALVRDIKEQARRSADRDAKRIISMAIQRLGAEQAAYDTGVHGLHPEMIKLIGRMRYRTSYGQNILEHSKEVAWLAGMMAAELHLDVLLAKRGALLHDVGKVLTHDSEGTHVELGVEVAKKYGESGAVINCIQAHHDDVPHESTESVLVQAADSISGSRPGARREAFESYVKRLTRL